MHGREQKEEHGTPEVDDLQRKIGVPVERDYRQVVQDEQHAGHPHREQHPDAQSPYAGEAETCAPAQHPDDERVDTQAQKNARDPVMGDDDAVVHGREDAVAHKQERMLQKTRHESAKNRHAPDPLEGR